MKLIDYVLKHKSFFDVYGVFLSLSGSGYPVDELKDYADLLKKELLRVPDVAKVALWRVQDKTVTWNSTAPSSQI